MSFGMIMLNQKMYKGQMCYICYMDTHRFIIYIKKDKRLYVLAMLRTSLDKIQYVKRKKFNLTIDNTIQQFTLIILQNKTFVTQIGHRFVNTQNINNWRIWIWKNKYII